MAKTTGWRTEEYNGVSKVIETRLKTVVGAAGMASGTEDVVTYEGTDHKMRLEAEAVARQRMFTPAVDIRALIPADDIGLAAFRPKVI